LAVYKFEFMADIEIVRPIAGARRVSFNYDAAGAALDVLSTMGSKLGDQATGRQTAHDAVVTNWLGYYRNEFDRAHGVLQSSLSAGAELAGYATFPIWEAIAAANQRQRELNDEREQQLAGVPHGAII
jgi:hypothetical protein